MAVTPATLKQLRDLRTQVGALADDAVREIAEAWLAAWNTLTPVWQAAITAAVAEATRTGRWPSSWQLARIPEVGAAVTVTEQHTSPLLKVVTAAAITAAVGAVTAAVAAEPLILAAQLPAALTQQAQARFAAKIQPAGVDTVRAHTGRRITNLMQPLTSDMLKTTQQTLVRGVPAAHGPTATVNNLLTRMQAAFFAMRDRAVNVARTECLDAMRAASAHVHDANAEALAGWTWWASLGPSCCPACWAMHGTSHPLSEEGPADHNQGRCVRLVRVKPWATFGITDPEPADLGPDAETRFRKLSTADQLKIMGPARLRMLNDAEITWADLVMVRTTRGWRDSVGPRTVADLRRIAGRRNP